VIDDVEWTSGAPQACRWQGDEAVATTRSGEAGHAVLELS